VRARAARATASTAANERSSRSHSVVTLHVTVAGPGGSHRAKLHMVRRCSLKPVFARTD
jgi:hypothetical protein